MIDQEKNFSYGVNAHKCMKHIALITVAITNIQIH